MCAINDLINVVKSKPEGWPNTWKGITTSYDIKLDEAISRLLDEKGYIGFTTEGIKRK